MSRRGPKPKPESEKRKHPVTCRLTDIEAVKVDERRGQMTRGEWIRTAALKRPPKIIPTVNREAWLALSKLAGNLNQIAKAVNQGLVSDIGCN